MRARLGTARIWLPFVVGFACFVAVSSLPVGAAVSWLLLLAGLVLVFDACTAMFARAGRTGGLSSHRQ